MGNILHFLVKGSVFFMTCGIAAFFPAFWRNGPKTRTVVIEHHYYERGNSNGNHRDDSI